MIGLLYRLLVLLHPPAFRREFGAEMVWIFCESQDRLAFLFGDALASLARQWVVRSGAWIPVAACIYTSIPFALAIFIGRVLRRGLAGLEGASQIAFFMLTAVTAVFAISATLALCVLWFRYSRRHLLD